MQRRVKAPFGEIEYTFTPKAVKNINIRVLRTGEVTVSAPRRADPRLADAFVIKKAEFILRARERLRYALWHVSFRGLRKGQKGRYS